MSKRQITKKQYERAKRIVTEYEAKFALSFVRGLFKASDLAYSRFSVSVPRIKDGEISESSMSKLQDYLDDMGIHWFEIGTDDMGFLVIAGNDKWAGYEDYEAQILEALNNL